MAFAATQARNFFNPGNIAFFHIAYENHGQVNVFHPDPSNIQGQFSRLFRDRIKNPPDFFRKLKCQE